MCGITGYALSEIDHESNLIQRMTSAIRHRGPDDEGIEVINNVALGFRRLSIIDLSGGHQPMSNESGTIWITFNGEIYNYKFLRAELQKAGHFFRTQSDTEVLLALYESKGTQCLNELQGMFAFTIYDTRKGILFGARDHFGIKPLYFSTLDGKFLYASEIKSILQDGSVSTEIDPVALDEYITYGYILGDRTIYKGIRKLRPGYYFILKTEGTLALQIQKYWEPKFEPDISVSLFEFEDLIRKELRESVSLMMNSDVPYGAFLSGGIDSSSVVAMMAEVSAFPVKTFSIGFKEKDFNELKYAREVARMYGTDHHEEIVSPGSVEIIDELVKIYDEPFADSSAIPTFLVSQFARKHVTMVLSGDGGDELFAGYSRYAKMMRLHERPLNNPYLNKLIFGTLAGWYPDHFPGKGMLYYLSLDTRDVSAYMGIFKPYERLRMYNADFIKSLAGHHAEDHMIQELKQLKGDYISRVQLMEMKNYLTDDVLTKVDRASMAASIEVRVPLLDQKFFKAVSKIPSDLKIQNGNLKKIFRSAMKDYLPASVAEHKKQGFGVPLKHWFRNELNDYIHQKLVGKHSQLINYLRPEFISGLITGHEMGQRDYSYKLWSLLFLEVWLEKSRKL